MPVGAVQLFLDLPQLALRTLCELWQSAATTSTRQAHTFSRLFSKMTALSSSWRSSWVTRRFKASFSWQPMSQRCEAHRQKRRRVARAPPSKCTCSRSRSAAPGFHEQDPSTRCQTQQAPQRRHHCRHWRPIVLRSSCSPSSVTDFSRSATPHTVMKAMADAPTQRHTAYL